MRPKVVTNDSGPVEHKVFTIEPGEVISEPAKTQAITDEPAPAKATLNQTWLFMPCLDPKRIAGYFDRIEYTFYLATRAIQNRVVTYEAIDVTLPSYSECKASS
jgi:hypothetical protein